MGGWVDMEMDDEDQLSAIPLVTNTGKPLAPQYPYGLKICLCEKEIEKLGIADSLDLDDVFVFKARAIVKAATRDGMDDVKRVELQIVSMKSVMIEPDDDGDEDDVSKPEPKVESKQEKRRLPYGKKAEATFKAKDEGGGYSRA